MFAVLFLIITCVIIIYHNNKLLRKSNKNKNTNPKLLNINKINAENFTIPLNDIDDIKILGETNNNINIVEGTTIKEKEYKNLSEILNEFALENEYYILPNFKKNDFISLYIPQLEKAIKNDNKVKILYRNTNGETKERILSKIQMTDEFTEYRYFNEHIKAYCHLRNERRSFKISRIVKLEIID